MARLVQVRLLKNTRTAKKGERATVDELRAAQWEKDRIAEKAEKAGK